MQYPGVFVREKVFRENLRLLTGYLRFKTTAQLRNWTRQDEIGRILKAFVEAWQDSFGFTSLDCIDIKTVKMVSVRTIMRSYNDPAILHKLKDIENIGQIELGVDKPLLANILVIRKILELDDKVFPEGIDPENVHRMVYLLKYMTKSSGKARCGLSRDYERDATAIAPTFFSSEPELPTASPSVETAASRTYSLATTMVPIDESGAEDFDDNTTQDHFDPLATIEGLLPDKISNDLLLAPFTESSRVEFVKSLAADPKGLNIEEHKHQVTQNDLLRNAITSETLSESDQKSQFCPLNRMLNTVTATEPDYMAACTLLSLDPDCPKFGDITLHPWQVTGAAWMSMQEQSAIKGGILGDGCGLGKTIQSLYHICHRANTGCAPFYPSLVVAPSQLVYHWFSEATYRFPNKFTILLFYDPVGTGEATDPIRKRHVVNYHQLNGHLEDLSLDDRQSGRTLIITSYTMFENCAFKKVGNKHSELGEQNQDRASHSGYVGHGHTSGNSDFANESDEASDRDDEDPTKGDEYLKNYRTIRKHHFERVILDEGHAVRKILNKAHQSIAQCSINYRWVIAGTGVVEGTSDIRGFLSLLHRPEWNDVSSLDYKNASDPVKEYFMCDVGNEKGDLHLLDPELFRRTFSHGNLSVEDSWIVLPRILRKLRLRRSIGSRMRVQGNAIVIGAQIPSYGVKTVEVVMSKVHQMEYVNIHRSLTADLRREEAGSVTDEQTKDMGGRYDTRVYQRLRHASFAFGLEHLYRSTVIKGKSKLAKDMAKWKMKPGGELIWLLSRMMSNPTVPFIPLDRSFIAKFMINNSPKFPTLLAVANRVVLQGKRPLLAVLNYSLPQFETVSFLQTCGFRVAALKPSMSLQERSQIAQEFGQHSGKIEILVVTYATCSIALNLHFNCSDVVLLELAFDFNTILQMIGQVHRLGQQRNQNIWIVSTAHTFDRYVEFTQSRKMISQIIGMGSESFKDLGSDQPSRDHEGFDSGTTPQYHLFEERADKMLQKLLGQPSSRLKFYDMEDLGLSQKADSATKRLADSMSLGSRAFGSKAVLDAQGIDSSKNIENLASTESETGNLKTEKEETSTLENSSQAKKRKANDVSFTSDLINKRSCV